MHHIDCGRVPSARHQRSKASGRSAALGCPRQLTWISYRSASSSSSSQFPPCAPWQPDSASLMSEFIHPPPRAVVAKPPSQNLRLPTTTRLYTLPRSCCWPDSLRHPHLCRKVVKGSNPRRRRVDCRYKSRSIRVWAPAPHHGDNVTRLCASPPWYQRHSLPYRYSRRYQTTRTVGGPLMSLSIVFGTPTLYPVSKSFFATERRGHSPPIATTRRANSSCRVSAHAGVRPSFSQDWTRVRGSSHPSRQMPLTISRLRGSYPRPPPRHPR